MNNKYLSAWRGGEELPDDTEPDFIVTRLIGKSAYGYDAARQAAEKWSLADGVAIGAAGSTTKLPAICVPEFRDLAEENHKKRATRTSFLLIAFLVLIPVVGFIKNQVASAIGPTLLVALSLAVWLADEIFYLRKKNNLAERGRFVFWTINNQLMHRAFVAVWLWSTFLFLGQCAVEGAIGGREILIEKFGFVYEKAASGEYWRVLTAPWIHASLFHLANNAMLTAFAFPFVYLYRRFRSITYFFSGALSGQVAQWLIFPVGDVLVGISAGTFALFGAALGICIRYRESLPAGVYLKVAYLGIITMVAAHILNPQSAGVAHVIGFSLGLFGELFLPTRKNH
jgi:membrane associated rhomboid family serine protease